MLWKIRRHVVETHFFVRYQCSKCHNMLARPDNHHSCCRQYGKSNVNFKAIYTKPLNDGTFEKCSGDDAIKLLHEFKDTKMDRMIKLFSSSSDSSRRSESHDGRGRTTEKSKVVEKRKSTSEHKGDSPTRKARKDLDVTSLPDPISPLQPSPKTVPLYEYISDDDDTPARSATIHPITAAVHVKPPTCTSSSSSTNSSSSSASSTSALSTSSSSTLQVLILRILLLRRRSLPPNRLPLSLLQPPPLIHQPGQ